MLRNSSLISLMVAASALVCSSVVPAQEEPESAKKEQPTVLALEMGYARDTYVPSLTFGVQLGPYIPECYLPITVVARDANNEGKPSVSWTAGVSVGALLAAGLIHSDDAPGLRNVLTYGIVFPLLALNSRHHLVLAGPGGLLEAGGVRLTAFAGSRTDCFSPGITWVRWTPMLGLRQEVKFSDNFGRTTGNLLAISEGVELPVGDKAPPSRLFVALKYTFPAEWVIPKADKGSRQ